MALEGSIRDFGVADILQLISQQQKTGILLVEKPEESVEVYFMNGAITETRSSQQTTRLGEILVKGNLISADHLKHAMEKHKETFEYLGQILLKEGLLKKDDLEHIIQTQIYETFYDILQWRDGHYRFIPQNLKADPAGLAQVPSLESILLDVLRMIDEWPDIKSTIRSFAYVFGIEPDKSEEALDADELLVYNLIDGKKTIQEIIDGCILGRFSACKILIGLLEQGYIRIIAEKSEKKPVEGTFSFQRIIGIASYAGLGISICILLLLPGRFPGSMLPALNQDYFQKSYLQKYLTNNAVQKLKKALEVFHLQYTKYPDSLKELVTAHILNDHDIKGYGGKSFTYTRQANSYTIQIQQ